MSDIDEWQRDIRTYIPNTLISITLNSYIFLTRQLFTELYQAWSINWCKWTSCQFLFNKPTFGSANICRLQVDTIYQCKWLNRESGNVCFPTEARQANWDLKVFCLTHFIASRSYFMQGQICLTVCRSRFILAAPLNRLQWYLMHWYYLFS